MVELNNLYQLFALLAGKGNSDSGGSRGVSTVSIETPFSEDYLELASYLLTSP
jgi:hypothetical protein